LLSYRTACGGFALDSARHEQRRTPSFRKKAVFTGPIIAQIRINVSQRRSFDARFGVLATFARAIPSNAAPMRGSARTVLERMKKAAAYE